MKRKFSVYPTTAMVMGEITAEQHIEQSAAARVSAMKKPNM